MMLKGKKILTRFSSLLLAAVLLITVTACDIQPTEESSENSALTEENIEIPESEYKAIFDFYVLPIGVSGLLFDDWDTPEEIAADRLLGFYGHNLIYHLPEYTDADAYTEVYVEFEKVFAYINRYFGASAVHLKTSSQYDENTQTVLFYAGGWGAPILPLLVTNAVQNGDVLTITLQSDPDVLSDNRVITLQIKLYGELFDDDWKYCSAMTVY